METKAERLKEELRKLERAGGIEGSAVVARNGLLIASNLPREIDERRLGAMSATMLGAVETAADTIEKGKVKRITTEIERAVILVTGAGKKALLVVTAREDANLGMLMVEMEASVDRIKKIMSE